MKSNTNMKSSINKVKIENNERNSRGLSAEQLRRPSKRLTSTISLPYTGRHSLAWRSSGRGGFKVPKYQNSYRLEAHLPFGCSVSDKVLAKIMTESLEGVTYDAEVCTALVRNMASDVRDCLYKTDYDRVKYVVTMSVIENTGQSLVMQNGRLWDPERDTYSVFVYESSTLFATGTVMVLYYE